MLKLIAPRQKTVFFLLEQIEGAGILSHCVDLADELTTRGYQIIFIYAGKENAKKGSKWLGEKGYKVYNIGFKRKPFIKAILSPRWLYLFIQLLIKYKPEIVHCHYRSMAFFALISKWLVCSKSILTIHLHNRSQNIFTRFYLEKFDAVVAISSAIKKELAGLKIEKERVFTIHNGVNSSLFLPASPELKKQLRFEVGLDSERLTIICVARLEKVKGIHVLIEALGLLPQDLRNKVQCLVLGEGRQSESLKDLTNKLGLQSIIHFLGYQHPAKFYRLSDVFVLPSLNEGFSVAVIEAMLSGLAIGMTPVSGSEDQVIEGFNGFIFPKNSPQILAKELEVLILQPEKLEVMQRNALIYSRENFASEQMGIKTSEVYGLLLSKNGVVIELPLPTENKFLKL